MDLKGASDAMTQRAMQNALENKQRSKRTRNSSKRWRRSARLCKKPGRSEAPISCGERPAANRQNQGSTRGCGTPVQPARKHRLVTRLAGRVRSWARAVAHCRSHLGRMTSSKDVPIIPAATL